MDLEFNVNHQIVTRTDKEKVVNFSDDYLRLCFNFETEDWTGASKFILVFCGDSVYRMALTDDKFVVPEELLTTQKLVFSIYGVTQSYRITTPKILLHLLIAGYDEQTKDLDVDEFTPDVVEQVYIEIGKKVNISDIVDDVVSSDTDKPLSAKQGKVLKGLVDSKADSSSVSSALDGKSDVGHSHTKSDITDFAHNHDDRYYTETEVNTLLTDLKNNIENKIQLKVDKTIIQDDETATLTAKLKQDGFVVAGATINFYDIGDE